MPGDVTVIIAVLPGDSTAPAPVAVEAVGALLAGGDSNATVGAEASEPGPRIAAAAVGEGNDATRGGADDDDAAVAGV